MPPDDDPLLAAVTAAPWYDLPRLVYADWLDDRGRPGDADRAEFIRLHCERWRTRERRRYRQPIRDHLVGLRAANEAAWRTALPALPGVEWGRYWRGFVAEARFASPADLVGQSAAVFAAAPVQFVQVGGLGSESVGAVCRVPQLVHLYGLRLDGVSLDLSMWRTLTGCDWFAALKHLIAHPPPHRPPDWNNEQYIRNHEIVLSVLAAAVRGGGRLKKVHMDVLVWGEDALQAEAHGRVMLTGVEDAFDPL